MSGIPLTLTFHQLAPSDLPRVGGKGANLGALTRAGVNVPPGFCVTTEAFDRFVSALPDAEALFTPVEALDGTSVDAARDAAEAMRSALNTLATPEGVARAIVQAWQALGPEHPLAVRSSATAEDLPGASFAGQQDTYLNVRGARALLDAVRRCWISLFTDRAVLYRARGGFGHRAVRLSVVVQRLIDPEVSGILFTADPITGHRRVVSIDAGFGLGEALVSGLISADLYRVDRRTGDVLLARPGKKAFAIRSAPEGGTVREQLSDEMSTARALNDAQLRALAEMGDRVERLYGGVPQDIEWCIAAGVVYVVQARPITSLFPLSDEPRADPGLRVYLSEIPMVSAERTDLPAGALPGTAVSAGVVEGIARVVTDPTRDTLHAGEILVAPYTDPGWTPLFVHAAGVVTEVGGMMTHGAVVAREYGIPAIVSVASAVDRIRTGHKIRVDGTRGFVEILEPGERG